MSADVHIQYSSTAVSFFFNEKNQLLRTPPKYSELAPLFLVLRRYYVIIMYYLCTKFVPCTGKSLIGKKYTLLIQPELSDIILLQFLVCMYILLSTWANYRYNSQAKSQYCLAQNQNMRLYLDSKMLVVGRIDQIYQKYVFFQISLQTDCRSVIRLGRGLLHH